MSEKVENTFDEQEFDLKVAREIVTIHRNIYKRNVDREFNEWVTNNETHLNELYKLSGLDADLNDFYNFVYDTTGI